MAIVGGLDSRGNIRDIRTSDRGALHTKEPPLRTIGGNHLVSAGAGAYALVPPAGATVAYLQVTGANIYWDDTPGTTPSSTVGHDANLGDDIYLWTWAQIDNFRAVRQGSTNFRIKASYKEEVIDDG